MIKKTILSCLVLFIMYSVFVMQFAPYWWHASQHQWQSNVIKAQKFLYNKNDAIQNVIIGSSLSCRIVADSLPNTYNLSFIAQSIFDGLKILTYKSKLPKTIFIEMNVVLRPENKEFTQSLTSPILYYPRKKIISLQEDRQPIAVFGFINMVLIEKIKTKFFPIQSNVKKTGSAMNTNISNDLFNKMLSFQVKEYSKEPNAEELAKAFNCLKEYVIKIEQENVKIIFFEIPVNKKLENLPKAKTIRESFYKYFPTDKYTYVPLPTSFKCQTTDGVHLSQDEAMRYTNYFKSQNVNYFH